MRAVMRDAKANAIRKLRIVKGLQSTTTCLWFMNLDLMVQLDACDLKLYYRSKI